MDAQAGGTASTPAPQAIGAAAPLVTTSTPLGASQPVAAAPAAAALASLGASSPVAAAPPAAAAPNELTEDIRDIRGPKPVLSVWLLAALLAGGVLLALAVYAVWRWRRNRRHPRVLLPFESALQQLDEIRALMQPAKAREFSIAVSDVVRRYIEQRFSVTATHRTTEEFLHDLLDSSNPSLARHRGVLSEFLNECDLAKFAGMSLSLQSMESLHQSARAFVLETAKTDEVTATRAPSRTTREAHDSLPST